MQLDVGKNRYRLIRYVFDIAIGRFYRKKVLQLLKLTP